MIRLEDVTLAVGGTELLVHVDLVVSPGDRIGLAGRNGTGKTTLLGALAGSVDPTAGRLRREPGLSVALLPQDAVRASPRPLWEEAVAAMARLAPLKERLDASEAALQAGRVGAVEALSEAMEAFRLAGGYAVDERVGEVLHGLGFRAQDDHRPCDTFSGGWRMRVALACVLLADPDLLLLDEPTNHLDVRARSWLAAYLAGWRRALVVVSHDRHLLDTACTRIAEIRSRRLHLFRGTFSAWLCDRERRDLEARRAAALQAEKARRLRTFVDRNRADKATAGQARARQRVLERLEPIQAPQQERIWHIRLPPTPPSAHVLVALRNVRAGWPDGPCVLEALDLEIERGMRLVLLGPNGSGKTTLIEILAGRLPLRAGQRRLGEGLRVGLFTQDQAADLPPEDTALDVLLQATPLAAPEAIRSLLGAFGISGDDALRPLGTLSGGERSRVALARLAVRPHNLLLLDEPTNHLDALTAQVLGEALANSDTAMVLATHDRALAEAVATHVGRFEDGRLEVHAGTRPEDFELPPPSARPTDRSEAGASAHAARKRVSRHESRLRRQADDLQRNIEAVEAEIAEVDAALCATDAWSDAGPLAARRKDLLARAESLYDAWEAVEADLADREAAG
ncbi:MAG: ABC-F family ATP-binding cassette domain-containing protein [Deltaproteobacteria bacterium]|nr:ABC-F family ATP-binding cassette domain-containing protein [Deltaproteobacteria bacterium]